MVAIQRRLDQSVQRTLRWIFALLGGMVLTTFVAWVLYGQFLTALLNTVYEDRVVPLRNLTLIADIVNVRLPGRHHAGGYGPGGDRSLDKDWEEVETIWRQYMMTYLTPKEALLADAARQSLDDIRERLVVSGPERSLGAGQDGVGYQHALRVFNERFNALHDLQVEVALENLKRAREVTHWAVVLAALAVLLVLLLAALTLQIITQRVVAPVEWVARSLQRLAEGDAAVQKPRFPLSALLG